MRNWIKYPPLEWRKRHDYCVPQGPIFTTARRSTLYLAGNRMRIKAPGHSPYQSMTEQVRLPKHDVLSSSSSIYWRGHWKWLNFVLMERSWAFYGPWMTGCKAELNLRIALISRFREFDEKEDPNYTLFYANIFERALLNYCKDVYGPNKSSNIIYYSDPVGWQWQHHLPVPSATFTLNPIFKSNRKMYPGYFFVFPVTDKHFVEVRFRKEIYSLDKEGRANFDVSPIYRLRDNIYNSISLDLGARNQVKSKR